MGLPDELVYYFGLYLIKQDESKKDFSSECVDGCAALLVRLMASG